jgi:predicted DsbA family dithiol-disulfide isomerase
MTTVMNKKLSIQIWSDMCPYCYIGKDELKMLLHFFGHEDAIEIEWKSFQLDASFVASPDDNIFDPLAEKYRKDRDWAVGWSIT